MLRHLTAALVALKTSVGEYRDCPCNDHIKQVEEDHQLVRALRHPKEFEPILKRINGDLLAVRAFERLDGDWGLRERRSSKRIVDVQARCSDVIDDIDRLLLQI